MYILSSPCFCLPGTQLFSVLDKMCRKRRATGLDGFFAARPSLAAPPDCPWQIMEACSHFCLGNPSIKNLRSLLVRTISPASPFKLPYVLSQPRVICHPPPSAVYRTISAASPFKLPHKSPDSHPALLGLLSRPTKMLFNLAFV